MKRKKCNAADFIFWAQSSRAKKMEFISGFFKQSVPHYFENLPIPNSFGGWFRLSFRDWLSLVPFGAAIGGLGYMSYLAFCPKAKCTFMINPSLFKDDPKHVDVTDIESIGDKIAICRCWRSKKFPYCDGAHNNFNKETGDNIGPFVVERNK